MANGSLSEHFFHIFLKAESRVYNPLQTVRCFPFNVHNTDQNKDLGGNYIISLETLNELVEMIESKRMDFFEVSQ